MKRLLITSGILITVTSVAGLVGYNSTKVEDLNTSRAVVEVEEQKVEQKNTKEIMAEEELVLTTETIIEPIVKKQFTQDDIISYIEQSTELKRVQDIIKNTVYLSYSPYNEENYTHIVDGLVEFLTTNTHATDLQVRIESKRLSNQTGV